MADIALKPRIAFQMSSDRRIKCKKQRELDVDTFQTAQLRDAVLAVQAVYHDPDLLLSQILALCRRRCI